MPKLSEIGKIIPADVQALYARQKENGSTNATLEEFAVLYAPTKTNNLDGLFSQVEKARDLAASKPGANMSFSVTDNGSNLTAEQKKVFESDAKALGIPVFKKSEEIALSTAEEIEFSRQAELLVNPSKEETDAIKIKIKAASEKSKPKEKNSLLDELLVLKGWK